MVIQALTRKDVSLDTGPNPDQYYDQICALSAKTINKNFESLWEQRPEMKKPLTFDNGDASIGTLKATMKPPRIMLEPNQEVEKDPLIYYSLVIDKGDIYYPGSPTINIDGWVITVAADLQSMIASPSDKMEEDAQWKAQDALDELTPTFELPERDPNKPVRMRAGEYSIHRLFAAISETRWQFPDTKRSTVRSDLINVSLSEWEKKSPQNLIDSEKVRRTLGAWASEHHYSAFFTLGLEVKVPNPKDDPLQPTFAPSDLRLQNYPYIDDADYMEFVKQKRTPEGIIDNDYNCLVWCETVEKRPLPSTQLLKFSGNLAMPANPSKGIGKEVVGTFVLDRRLFFEKHLLPELQEFCVATQIIPLKPTMETDKSKKGVASCISNPNVAVGILPDDMKPDELAALPVKPPKSAKDSYYAFTQTGPFNWEWKKTLEAPGSGTYIHYYGDDAPATPIYRKYKTVSEMSVKISRKPGTSTLIVESENNYRHWEGYYNNSNFPWDSKAGTDTVLWGEFFVKANWSVEVNLAPKGVENENGVISPHIEKINEHTWQPDKMNVNVPQMAYVLENADGNMKEQIKRSLSISLPHVVEALQTRFSAEGRFIYPGTGTLKFGPPQLSDNGQVYSDIDYKPLTKGRVKLRLPSKNFPLVEQPDRKPKITEITGGPPPSENLPRIQWTTSLEYDSKKGRAKLTLVGGNKTHDRIAFSRIKITMAQVKDLDYYGLFSEYKWEKKEEKKPPIHKPKSTPKPELTTKPEPATHSPEIAPKETPVPEKHQTGSAPVGNKLAGTMITGAELGNQAHPSSIPETPMPKDPQPKPEAKQEVEVANRELQPEPVLESESETETETEPEPEPENTWNITSHNVINGVYITGLTVRPQVVGQARLLEFSIVPEGKFRRDPRFVLEGDPETSTFTLELEGKVEMPGTYVLKMSETWSNPIMTVNPTTTEMAESWYTVRVEEGKKDCVFKWVTQKEAEAVQGITK